MDDLKKQLMEHLSTTRLRDSDTLESGDIITGAVFVLRVDRLDSDEPTFLVTGTTDYITATGLLALGAQVGMDNIVSTEEE